MIFLSLSTAFCFNNFGGNKEGGKVTKYEAIIKNNQEVNKQTKQKESGVGGWVNGGRDDEELTGGYRIVAGVSGTAQGKRSATW